MTDSSKPHFSLPTVHDSESGWGPSSTITPEQFREIPYAPYSKADKLGRVADWTNPEGQKQDNNQTTGGRQGRAGFSRFNRDQHQAYGASFASAFAHFHTEDESSFSVVDNRSAGTKKQALKAVGGGNVRNTRTQTTKQPGFRTVGQRPAAGRYQQQANRRRYGYKDYDKPQRVRNASITIGTDWKVLDEIEFSRLSKLNFNIPQVNDVATFGAVNLYNKAYDRVNTKNEKMLAHIDRVKYDTTTSEDPVIQKYIQENKATVFATDAVLSLLMCATRTVYPWDIVVKKTADGKVILDKRPGGVFDFVTVNENSYDPPTESDRDTINSWSSLCNEATYINQNFSRQVLDPKVTEKFDSPNPFATSDTASELASCGYRYREFNLTSADASEGAEQIHMIVRTEVDAAVKQGNTTNYVTIRALNEFDPTAQGAGGALPWKKSLDSQRGAVVATEMRNNAAKLARWAVQAILADAEQLKLGYVARYSPKDNTRHVILGTQAYKPRDFASQMNLSLTNGWGIVKAVVDMCLQLPEGTYVMMKDPNRPILRIYVVPSEVDLQNEDYDEEEEEEEAVEEEEQDEE
ncbi:eukaryotic translation initiation factor 3 subunit D [Gilbertella persicaria]|uniref:eukaryotic translation initiation factor 3 subunit D n=1 Tax=Gilbertella persicaria TaxID=101096 RepID=UPI002220867E|nr:eukaryotic translation initiation factor 3 subunit D [Gilbertella persicaria]KAI8047359.1 eukaryotic translation initiation factor 3 subunit D [Gilbertella persicaria]